MLFFFFFFSDSNHKTRSINDVNGREKKDIISLTPAQSTSISSILTRHNNILARVLIAEFNTMAQSLSFEQQSECLRLENFIRLLLILHTDPGELFLSCLNVELQEDKNLASIMRERSASVRVLQFIWKTLDIANIVTPFFHYFSQISNSTLKDLTAERVHLTSTSTPIITPRRTNNKGRIERTKKQLTRQLTRLLQVNHFPPVISSLCAKCVQIIEANQTEHIDTSVVQWVVGSLIFLRFLVPSITALTSDPSSSDVEKKGAVLIARLLMKLCCKSKFEHNNCLLNEILMEFNDYFDSFCDELIAVGKTQIHSLEAPWSVYFSHRCNGLVQSELFDFVELITIHEQRLNALLTTAMEREGIAMSGSEDESESHLSIRDFKNTIWNSVADHCPFIHSACFLKNFGKKITTNETNSMSSCVHKVDKHITTEQIMNLRGENEVVADFSETTHDLVC
jgi:hypothetical protein